MLSSRDTGQFVKGQCTFVQGVTFSNSSDLNENGLKLLHVIQEAITNTFAIFTVAIMPVL